MGANTTVPEPSSLRVLGWELVMAFPVGQAGLSGAAAALNLGGTQGCRPVKFNAETQRRGDAENTAEAMLDRTSWIKCVHQMVPLRLCASPPLRFGCEWSSLSTVAEFVRISPAVAEFVRISPAVAEFVRISPRHGGLDGRRKSDDFRYGACRNPDRIGAASHRMSCGGVSILGLSNESRPQRGNRHCLYSGDRGSPVNITVASFSSPGRPWAGMGTPVE